MGEAALAAPASPELAAPTERMDIPAPAMEFMGRYRRLELTECMEYRLAKTPASRELIITAQPVSACTVKPRAPAAWAEDFTTPPPATRSLLTSKTEAMQRFSMATSPRLVGRSRSIILSIRQISTFTTHSWNRRT